MSDLVWLVFTLAAIPAVLFSFNFRSFRRAPPPDEQDRPAVSVLIPARNEAAGIGAAVESVLANHCVDFELLVLDDNSEDDTAAVVQRIAAGDARVRLIPGPALIPGWCGKQHACHVLSQHASHEYLCFLDADVRLGPDALARAIAFMHHSRAPLVSGFPRQITRTAVEKLVLPLIHFVLLAYLPHFWMRRTRNPAFAAGCGQFMLVERQAYLAAGGHAAIRTSLHDGIKLPAGFRRAGFRTDVFDATDIAHCRMYSCARDVWFGLAKNAIEGMAAPRRILVFTVLLFGGQVLPFVLAAAVLPNLWPALAAAMLVLGPRVVAARRFQQSFASALLHPAGIVVLLGIQWYGLAKHLLGRPAGWKGRSYGPPITGSVSRH